LLFAGFKQAFLKRYIFDKGIAESPPGKIIIHATQDGKVAKDASFGRGGVFTISLLTVALTYRTGIEFKPVNILELLPAVNETIKQFGFEKEACLVKNVGNLEVPFLIDMQQQLVRETEPEVESNISFSRVFGIGLLIFGLYYLLRDK
jgi:hypothetical protein